MLQWQVLNGILSVQLQECQLTTALTQTTIFEIYHTLLHGKKIPFFFVNYVFLLFFVYSAIILFISHFSCFLFILLYFLFVYCLCSSLSSYISSLIFCRYQLLFTAIYQDKTLSILTHYLTVKLENPQMTHNDMTPNTSFEFSGFMPWIDKQIWGILSFVGL